MKTGAILQRSVMARQRQHGDEVELGIVLGDILQHLHHGRRGDQVVARQARAVGDDSIAEIDPSLLTQDLPYGIGARPPCRTPNRAWPMVRKTVSAIMLSDFFSMIRSRSCSGADWLVASTVPGSLASVWRSSDAAVGDPRTGQLGFEDRSGIAGAILNGEGQRQRLATLRQAAGESIAIEIARHHVELAILRFR